MPNVTNIQKQELSALVGVLNSNQPKTKYMMTKPLKVLIALFSVMVLYFLLTMNYDRAKQELGVLANVLFNETYQNLKDYGLSPENSMKVLTSAIFKFQSVLITTEMRAAIGEAIDTVRSKMKEFEVVILYECLRYLVCDMPRQLRMPWSRTGGTSSSHGLVVNQANATAIEKIHKEAKKACTDRALLRNLNLSTVQGRLNMLGAVKTMANGIPQLQGSMEKVALGLNLQNENVGEENVFHQLMIAFRHHLIAVAHRLREDIKTYRTSETHKSIKLFTNSRMFYDANGNLIVNWSPSGEPNRMYDVRLGQNAANENEIFRQFVLQKSRQPMNKQKALTRVERLYESLELNA